MAADKETSKDKNAAAAEAPARASAGLGGWMPVIALVVLVPVVSFAMAEFVLFPRLEQRLAASGVASGGAAGHGEARAHAPAPKSKSGPAAEPNFSYEFKDIITNLSGSAKSRYLKVGFTVFSADPELTKKIDANKAVLLDSTLSILGALSLADLEDNVTAKAKVRSQMLYAYESVLNGKVVEKIYFSDWVIQ